MIYRVIIKASYYKLYFDFKTAIDAMMFMDSAVTKYSGSDDEEPLKIEVLLQMVEAPTSADQ